jgi:hypothetical protein
MVSMGAGYINILHIILYYCCLLLIGLVSIFFFYYIFIKKLNWFNDMSRIYKIIEKIFYSAQVVLSGAFFLYCVILGYNSEKIYYPLTYVYVRREISLMYVNFSLRALKSKEKPVSDCHKIAPVQISNIKILRPITLEDFRLKDFS